MAGLGKKSRVIFGISLWGLICNQQSCALASGPCPSPLCKSESVIKAVNELQDAIGSGRQVSSRGFFARLIDAYPPMELVIPQDPPHCAMEGATTSAPVRIGVAIGSIHELDMKGPPMQ